MNILLIFFGKFLSSFAKALNLGHGSTWPGHIALSLNKNFIKDILKNSKTKIILIAGTNGKTTTAKLIKTILEKNGNSALQNESGANLLNGIASSLVLNSDAFGNIKKDFAIFEIDENSLPLVLQELTSDYLIILNLFRDQLDRYGEVNKIASKWQDAVKNLISQTTLILNADDPQIAYLGNIRSLSRGDEAVAPPRWNRSYTSVFYFGLEDKSLEQKTPQHASDSLYCPNCNTKLDFSRVYYSHLGIWKCPNCKLARPGLIRHVLAKLKYPLTGIYNRYNTEAAILLAKLNNVSNETIEQSLNDFTPSFGRQEMIKVDGKKAQLFLSKNPTSFNQSLRTIKELGGKHILLVLNDRIPDGRDVSWIWDVDFEDYLSDKIDVSVAGDRAYDMSLRLKYVYPAVKKVDTYYPFLDKGIHATLDKVPQNETLYILPTYSAMLEVRKILTGKKIL